MLTVVDVFTRECLAIEPGQHLGGVEVVSVLRRITAQRKAPKRIYCDHGNEFSGRLVDLWAYANGVVTQYRVVQWYAPERMPEGTLV